MSEFYLVDGKPIRALNAVFNIQDMGLLYGFSLFETILVRNSKPVLLWPHLDRMIYSADQLGLQLFGNRDDLAIMCRDAVSQSGLDQGVLRLTVTAGTACQKGHCIISVREGIPYTKEQYEKGIALLTMDFPRNEKSPLVQHKTANYLENLLGRREAQRRGYNEALFLNTRGHVAEGATSNIFIVQGGKILTPPVAAGLLPGTIRNLVLKSVTATGLLGLETDLYPWDLEQADECFATNSLMGVMPVTRLDNLAVGNGKPGPVTGKIMEMYWQAIK